MDIQFYPLCLYPLILLSYLATGSVWNANRIRHTGSRTLSSLIAGDERSHPTKQPQNDFSPFFPLQIGITEESHEVLGVYKLNFVNCGNKEEKNNHKGILRDFQFSINISGTIYYCECNAHRYALSNRIQHDFYVYEFMLLYHYLKILVM